MSSPPSPPSTKSPTMSLSRSQVWSSLFDQTTRISDPHISPRRAPRSRLACSQHFLLRTRSDSTSPWLRSHRSLHHPRPQSPRPRPNHRIRSLLAAETIRAKFRSGHHPRPNQRRHRGPLPGTLRQSRRARRLRLRRRASRPGPSSASRPRARNCRQHRHLGETVHDYAEPVLFQGEAVSGCCYLPSG